MTQLDKFFADADKLVKKAGSPETGIQNKNITKEASRLFMGYAHDYGSITEHLCDYWENRYSNALGTETGRREAVNWLGNLLALLSGNFSDQMDFPDEDWDEIREAVNAEADELDMDLLSTILTVIVERGKSGKT